MAQLIVKESASLEKILAKLPIDLRAKSMQKAVRAGGKVVQRRAKELAPVGDPNDKPHLKPLKDTITTVVRAYRSDQLWVAVVGPGYPAGAHGHLLEFGHEVIVNRGERAGQTPLTGSPFVEGNEFMAPAVDQTLAQQDAAVVKSLESSLKKASEG